MRRRMLMVVELWWVGRIQKNCSALRGWKVECWRLYNHDEQKWLKKDCSALTWWEVGW